jgi:hypothetical protein
MALESQGISLHGKEAFLCCLRCAAERHLFVIAKSISCRKMYPLNFILFNTLLPLWVLVDAGLIVNSTSTYQCAIACERNGQLQQICTCPACVFLFFRYSVSRLAGTAIPPPSSRIRPETEMLLNSHYPILRPVRSRKTSSVDHQKFRSQGFPSKRHFRQSGFPRACSLIHVFC